MKTKKIFTFLILSISVFTLTAKAEKYVLNLNKSIEIAKAKSYQMQTLIQDFKIADYNLKSATSRFKTHINLTMTLPEYTETIRQDQDSSGILFYPMKQLKYSGRLTVNQPLPTDGNIFFTSGLNNFDDYNASYRTTNTFARIGFRQPLHALYGYNSIRSHFKKAKLDYERSEKALKRAELNLVYEVSSSFYNLLSVQKSQGIAKLNLEIQISAYKTAKSKYDAGLIKEVDALQMEVDLAQAQNDYDMSIVNQESALNSFKRLIGIELDDVVELDSDLKYEVVIVNEDDAVAKALENRPEIREQEIQLELQRLNIKQQKMQGMIRADFTGYYEKVGVNSQNIEKSIGTSIERSYNNFLERPQSFGVGLTVTVPVFDWGENRALVKAAEARLEQSKLLKKDILRSIEIEVRNTVGALNSSLKRLQLLEKSLKVAEKSFEITRQRYNDGDIDSQSLALERNRLNNAYISRLRAYINYQMQLVDLTRKTYFDYRKRK